MTVIKNISAVFFCGCMAGPKTCCGIRDIRKIDKRNWGSRSVFDRRPIRTRGSIFTEMMISWLPPRRKGGCWGGVGVTLREEKLAAVWKQSCCLLENETGQQLALRTLLLVTLSHYCWLLWPSIVGYFGPCSGAGSLTWFVLLLFMLSPFPFPPFLSFFAFPLCVFYFFDILFPYCELATFITNCYKLVHLLGFCGDCCFCLFCYWCLFIESSPLEEKIMRTF